VLTSIARSETVFFHPSMMAVVDHELRVHDLQALRVADASIIPTVVSGNTNAACIMIGEKCAGLMLAAR
jgi:choline dehydrogenase